MARLRWTKEASNDVVAICEFVSRDSVYYGKMFTRDVLEAVERLESFRSSIMSKSAIMPSFECQISFKLLHLSKHAEEAF